MKLFLFVLILLSTSTKSFSQGNPAQQLALKQAKRMQDTLKLTSSERNQIVDANLKIYQWKSKVRLDYNGNFTEIQKQTQIEENKRDSLYRLILTADKFRLYQQKKRILLAN